MEILAPQRGDKRKALDHALLNAKEALIRRIAESGTQMKLLRGIADLFGLDQPPKRIEVYDNSHISGTNPVRRDDRRGARRLHEEPVSQVRDPPRRAGQGPR